MKTFVGRLVLGLVCASSLAWAQPRIAGRFGEAFVGNQKVLVHVTVAVPPGRSDNEATENALRGHGARPLQSAEFQTTGLVWDQFKPSGAGGPLVAQNYNSQGEPLPTLPSLLASQATWTNVVTSRFGMTGGTTTRCPSLLKECGRQTFDGFNDVKWVPISGCCTLAVTWYSTTTDEADMGINLNFAWSTDGSGGIDLETVLLHENGHVAGLDHSTIVGSIMEATYAGVRRFLHEDDLRAVTYLYPETNATGNISGVVKNTSGAAIAGATITIPNFPGKATSNSGGAYVLSGVPQIGSYSVTAAATGYTSATITGIFVHSTTANFTLQGGTTSGGGGGCIPKGKSGNCK